MSSLGFLYIAHIPQSGYLSSIQCLNCQQVWTQKISQEKENKSFLSLKKKDLGKGKLGGEIHAQWQQLADLPAVAELRKRKSPISHVSHQPAAAAESDPP